jgi:hypothetical protein
VYSFGTNYEGRLGLGPGSELYQHKPKRVHLPAGNSSFRHSLFHQRALIRTQRPGEFATAVSASEHSLVLTRTCAPSLAED